MSRNEDSESLKNVIGHLLKDYKLETKFMETRIPEIWSEVVGKYITERTLKVFVKGNILYAQISSAPLKQEMMHNRETVIRLINEKIGQNLIKELIIQ